MIIIEKIVEIGTEEQREIILKELEVFDVISDKFSNNGDEIYKIIIPDNLDTAVRKISKDNTFESIRTNTMKRVVGKVIYFDEGIILLFSPFLFTEEYDMMVRCTIYIHELFHIVNKHCFPDIDLDDDRLNSLLKDLNWYYDDYFCNRKGIEIVDDIFKEHSQIYINHLKKVTEGHKSKLEDDSLYYDKIKNLIYQFKLGNISFDDFYSKVNLLITGITMDFVFFSTYLDSYDFLSDYKGNITNSMFYNEYTIDLLDFFKQCYHEDIYDLSKGIELYEKYLLNFGIKFENVCEGVYCHVFNI